MEGMTINSQREELHCGAKPGRFETYHHTIFLELASEQASERMSAAERASEASSVDQANE